MCWKVFLSQILQCFQLLGSRLLCRIIPPLCVFLCLVDGRSSLQVCVKARLLFQFITYLCAQLSVEKSELQEEKSLLETETGRLQDQLNQSVDNNQSAQLPGFHPGLMTNSQFSYPLMIKASLSSKDIISQDSIPDQTHQMPVSPFFSVAPFLHPAYQTYGMLGSRQSPYSHFSHPGQHIHVGRPAARYPVPIHPTPIYPSKIAQAKALDPPTIVTDLQLQTPSSKTQHSVSDQDQCENTTSTMVSFFFI